jgi:hypothetical protein
MKKFLTHAVVASTSIATAAVARASEAPDSGVTEMNAGMGTVGMLLGGVAAMGVAIWLLLKVLNRGRK